MAPATTSLCPPMYLVAACTTRSTPFSRGFWNNGVDQLLSITVMAPCCLASSATWSHVDEAEHHGSRALEPHDGGVRAQGGCDCLQIVVQDDIVLDAEGGESLGELQGRPVGVVDEKDVGSGLGQAEEDGADGCHSRSEELAGFSPLELCQLGFDGLDRRDSGPACRRASDSRPPVRPPAPPASRGGRGMSGRWVATGSLPGSRSPPRDRGRPVGLRRRYQGIRYREGRSRSPFPGRGWSACYYR